MAFVVRAFPRCGTHMLRTALNHHPNLTCHNEVFNPDFNDPEEIKALGAEGVYQKYTGPTSGFIAHGYTEYERFAQSHQTLALWDILIREQTPIIILTRDDLLRRCFSLYQARKTNRWHVWRAQKNAATIARPKVQAHELEWQINTALASFDFAKKNFEWGFFISYEELVDQWHKRSREIQEYLGARPIVGLTPQTVKQDTRPIHEMVVNYQELRELYEDTEFEQWFEYAEANDESRRAVR